MSNSTQNLKKPSQFKKPLELTLKPPSTYATPENVEVKKTPIDKRVEIKKISNFPSKSGIVADQHPNLVDYLNAKPKNPSNGLKTKVLTAHSKEKLSQQTLCRNVLENKKTLCKKLLEASSKASEANSKIWMDGKKSLLSPQPVLSNKCDGLTPVLSVKVNAQSAIELENVCLKNQNEELKVELKDYKLHNDKEKFELNKIIDSLKEREPDFLKQLQELENQNKLLQDRINQMDQNHFSEMKSVYDKYIALQKQIDVDKDGWNNKYLNLQQNLANANSENQNLKKLIEQLKRKNKNNADTVKEQQRVYEETTKKFNMDISHLNYNIENLKHDNECCLVKLETQNEEIKKLKSCIDESHDTIDNLKSELLAQENNMSQIVNNFRKQELIFENKINMLEEDLQNQNNINANLRNVIAEKEEELTKARAKLNELECEIKELSIDLERISNLENQLKLKSQEIFQLRDTCKTLQSTNEFLNVRLSSVNEMLQLQELCSKDHKGNRLLQVWREKVYSLIVLLKTQELKENESK